MAGQGCSLTQGVPGPKPTPRLQRERLHQGRERQLGATNTHQSLVALRWAEEQGSRAIWEAQGHSLSRGGRQWLSLQWKSVESCRPEGEVTLGTDCTRQQLGITCRSQRTKLLSLCSVDTELSPPQRPQNPLLSWHPSSDHRSRFAGLDEHSHRTGVPWGSVGRAITGLANTTLHLSWGSHQLLCSVSLADI